MKVPNRAILTCSFSLCCLAWLYRGCFLFAHQRFRRSDNDISPMISKYLTHLSRLIVLHHSIQSYRLRCRSQCLKAQLWWHRTVASRFEQVSLCSGKVSLKSNLRRGSPKPSEPLALMSWIFAVKSQQYSLWYVFSGLPNSECNYPVKKTIPFQEHLMKWFSWPSGWFASDTFALLIPFVCLVICLRVLLFIWRCPKTWSSSRVRKTHVSRCLYLPLGPLALASIAVCVFANNSKPFLKKNS